MTNTQAWVADYTRIKSVLPGQSVDWLQSKRSRAFQRFEQDGFPSLREEEWRYTNVSSIEKKRFSPQLLDPVSSSVDVRWLAQYRVAGALQVVFLNGRLAPELSSLGDVAEGVVLLSMSEALEQQPGLVKGYFAQAVSDDEHRFVAFNTAWFSDGLFLHVPRNQSLTQPIQLLHVITQADCLASTRHILALDSGVQAEVIEMFVGVDEAYLTASVTEVIVAENAALTLYKMQTEADKAYHFGGTYVKQAQDSRFKHHNFALGGLLARNDIHSDLAQAASCDLNGLYVGSKRQHLDNHTRICHAEPYASSRELYKGVLDGRARGVFQGRVIVAENAQKTDSVMNNRNLLLSDRAEVDTKPQLEIYADDVKCAHGVTVGQLDEKSVFYLQSRCVDEVTARNMLTFAFANEMVDKVLLSGLHDVLLKQLLTHFPQSLNDEGVIIK